MKLYNPILNGRKIVLENNQVFDIDQTTDFSNGLEMIDKYPFLIEIEKDEYQPDNCEQIKFDRKFREIVRDIKIRIKNVLE